MATPGRDQDVEEGRRRGNPADGLGGRIRRLLARTPSQEVRVERLLAERSLELEAQASRFEETVTDLERREERLRDQHASVERLLRRGASDLEERETELVELDRELAVRESRVDEQEAELARRRSELGAVELKRAAVEGRERTLAAREAEIETRETELGGRGLEREAVEGADGTPDRMLLFVPGPAYRLVEVDTEPLAGGDELQLEGEAYEVARIGRSPLPGDRRRCAYLVRGPRGDVSGGSS